MDRKDAFPSAGTPATFHSPITELDLPSLWQAYVVSRDESLRNRLLIHYMPLSKMIARHLHGKMPADVELDDLAQAAFLGMRAAIATFNPDRGIPFEHYCGPRVRGAVFDYLRSLDWAPRMLRSRVLRMKTTIRQIEMETGIPPTDEEVSQALNVSSEEYHTLKREMAGPVWIRLNGIPNGEDGETHTTMEMFSDEGALDPRLEAQRGDLREFLEKGLSQVERQVLLLYYYDSMSLREIGETLNLCESRVSQIHQVVIKRLRERMDRIGGASVED
jgi:RNA polymerase sigma factor for flagellar operon FliA